METQITSIANLFGDVLDVKFKEDFQRLVCELTLTLTKEPSSENLQTLLPSISKRDTLRLRLLTEAGEDLFDLRTESEVGTDYDSSKLEPYRNDEVRLILSVDKNKNNGVITVYDYRLFLEYIQALDVHDFIRILKNSLDDKLVFEVWDGDAERFSTSSIAIIKRGESTPSLSRDLLKVNRANECREQCQWNNKLSDLLPEDVRIIQRGKEGRFAKFFDQLCLLLSAVYVTDFSSIDKNGIKLRMSGFKMMVTETRSSKLSSLSFDTKSVEQWYKIYDWCYTGGYTTDRLSIARNLITLNCPDTQNLLLNASTYDAIKSNFKIFEKDNVRQYIKVRNEVSKTLLDLQDKVNSTVESFTGDFRKSVVGLGTFFLTLVVARVVANGRWTGAFSTQIVMLSFVFIILSSVILYYSRKAMDKKEQLFNKHYQQLKHRYEALLSKEELDELFEDGDPNKVGSHSNYIQWQRKTYTLIWIGMLLAFSLFLIIVWCYNLFVSPNVGRIINAIIECCTKNI